MFDAGFALAFETALVFAVFTELICIKDTKKCLCKCFIRLRGLKRVSIRH
jgi:hypothetical protein